MARNSGGIRGSEMCAQHDNRDTFDCLASEYDELKLRVIPAEVIWSWEKFALFYAAKPVPAA